MKNKSLVIGVVLLVAGMGVELAAQTPAGETEPGVADNVAQQTTPVDANPQQQAAPPATTQFAAIIPGLYQSEESGVEFNAEDDGFNGTGVYKLQLDLKADGTFTMTGYVTAADAGFKDQPIFRIRGRWQQDGRP
ncbi:MAG: hypothetical protein R3F37_16045 [Candidatus Competibacteraceae bacterium]